MNIKNRVVYALGQTKIFYFYLFTALMMTVIIWFWYSLFYISLLDYERQTLINIELLEKKKLLLPDLRYAVSSLKNKCDILQTDLKSCLLQHVCQDPYLQLERILVDLDDVGLHVTAFNPQEAKKKSFYDRDTISFKVQGKFEHIVQFLKLFNSHNMLAKFKKMIIHPNEDGLMLDSTVALYTVEKE